MPDINIATTIGKIVVAIIQNRNKLSRNKDDVVTDLKFLRFNDDGVLSLIDAMIEGEKIRTDMLDQILSEFNDYEWKVADAIERLSKETLLNTRGIARLTADEIEQIGFRKVTVRKAVQQRVNYYGRRGNDIKKDELIAIKAGIMELNQEIDRAERLLVHGA